jgi:imidazoleglycerol-phosphate dehydratase / histidinol-phosphatase
MKKVLFIDRDGTLVVEPPIDFQLDSLEKLTYLPGVFQYLSAIVKEMDYELVMVTNQDGLGTESFPEDTFWPTQNKIIEALKNEGVIFSNVLIDKSFAHENKDTRKPGVGMLQAYIFGQYDLANSYVIGDRETDIELAKNLNCKSIGINISSPNATLNVSTWKEIYENLKAKSRTAMVQRNTNETAISINLNLDGSGNSDIDTGIKFFDHMLDQLARHGNMDLSIKVKGDLEIDEHHTIEDTAIALGEAVNKAIGNKKGIERYGFLLPMDDCLAQVAIDFGGRPWLVWDATFNREKVGEMPTEMFMHFFKSFSDNAKCNLNVKAEGENEHHKIEAIFKAFAKAIKMAVAKTNNNILPSTKGTL